MPKRNISGILNWLFPAVALLLLVNFLWWHWRLGLTRYFDVDEYAYLHWAYQIFSGQKPYVDFFLYVPPGYQWFLAPLFWLGRGAAPLVVGRIQAFLVFVGLTTTLVYLYWQLRKSWLAILAGAILAFLPLPLDKFLEMRPDTLAAWLVLIGIVLEISWLRKNEPLMAGLAGIFYGLSLIVLPKSLPAVAVAVAVALIFSFKNNPKKSVKAHKFLPFGAGLILPIILFGLWALTLGNLKIVMYSLFKLPFEVNKISEIFYMSPDLFFYPNNIFYGLGGWSQGLIVNHLLWLLGLFMGILALLTPYLASNKSPKTELLEEILISGIFIIQVVYYVLWSPLKHAQYLIPIAVFIAFYTADGFDRFWQWARGSNFKVLTFSLIFVLFAVVTFQTNILAESPKLIMSNKQALSAIKKIRSKIPKSEYLLDLDGRTLYYPSPYYVCCLPFGQYTQFLTQPLPSLSGALEQTKTKYIWQGELNRVTTLPAADQQYIAAHYGNSKEIEGLLVRTEF